MIRSVITFLKRLLTRRLLKIYTWVILFLATAITLFYVEENWRGAHAYQKAKEAYLERGGTLNLSDILPPRVESDENNFCALPVVRNLAEEMRPFEAIKDVTPERRSRSKEVMLKRREAKPGWDLWGTGAWRHTPAEVQWDHAAYWMRDALGWVPKDSSLSSVDQVLLALRQFDPLIRRFAAGIDRPHAQFIPQLDQRRNGKLLQEVRGLALERSVGSVMRLLQLRGLAAAESGRGDLVFESLAIMTKFQLALSDEVRSIDFSYAIMGLGLTNTVLHHALQTRKLTKSQLEDLQTWFSRMAIMPQVDRVMKAELLGYLELWDYLKVADYDELRQWCGGKSPSWKLRLAPAGWWDLFKADLLQNGLRGQPSYPFEWEEGWPPDLSNTLNRTLPWLIKKHQMEIACALERHFLDHGAYPETLQNLIPNYFTAVPLDMDDQPMRYRRTPDGRYAVYSVGYDLKDDGGTPTGAKPYREDYKGDWTWSF